MDPGLTVMKPLPATYLCKGRCVLAEAARALRNTDKTCDPSNQRETTTLSHLYGPEDVGKEHSVDSQRPWDSEQVNKQHRTTYFLTNSSYQCLLCGSRPVS